MSRMRCTKKRVFHLRHNTERDEQTYRQTDRQTDTSGLEITFERASHRRYTGSTRTTLVVGSITFERASLLRYTGSTRTTAVVGSNSYFYPWHLKIFSTGCIAKNEMNCGNFLRKILNLCCSFPGDMRSLMNQRKIYRRPSMISM